METVTKLHTFRNYITVASLDKIVSVIVATYDARLKYSCSKFISLFKRK